MSDRYSAPMARKSLAVLLLLSWIILSGFDLLEDLGFETGNSAYSQGSTNNHLLPHLKHRSSLANNIVESAASAQQFYPLTLRLIPNQSPIHPVLSFHTVFDLHKLHRVFLI